MPQQRRQGRLGRTPSPPVSHTGPRSPGVWPCFPWPWAATPEEEAAAEREASKKTAAVEVVAPADVEVIANLTGCKVTIRIEAKELREGACHTETGDYLITTFPEERHKVTWLDSAAIYGAPISSARAGRSARSRRSSNRCARRSVEPSGDCGTPASRPRLDEDPPPRCDVPSRVTSSARQVGRVES